MLNVGVVPSRTLIRTGGDPHAWGGPQIRWADQQNSEVMFFALDDVAEEREWENVDVGVEIAVHALNVALGALHHVITLTR